MNEYYFLRDYMYEAFQDPVDFTYHNFHQHVAEWVERVNGNLSDSRADEIFLGNRGTADGWLIWYTEASANWDSSIEVNIPPEQASWGRCLVDALMNIYLYGKGEAAMLLQFQFNSLVKDSEGTLYNRAKAFIPLMRASKDATYVASLSFVTSGMPVISGTDDMTVVQGLAFKTKASEFIKCTFLNLSDQPVSIDLSNIYEPASGALALTSWAYEGVADVDPAIWTSTSIVQANNVMLPAFSSSYIERDVSTTAIVKHPESLRIGVQNNRVTIYGLDTGESVGVYSLAGQLVHQQIVMSGQMTLSLPSGLFIIRSNNRVKKVFVPATQ